MIMKREEKFVVLILMKDMFDKKLLLQQLNSNVSGLASPRVPLPRQPYDEELIYVNPKQYHGILRRRQLRSKLEAKKKLTKDRKVRTSILLFNFVSFVFLSLFLKERLY